MLSAGLFPNAASSSPEQNVVYTLDALNRRVQRQEQRPQGNFARENYYHDGWDIDSVDERFNQTLTRRAWFSMGDTDDLYTMTVWNPATGGPSTTSYYYSTDHLGSVRALHADDGTIVTDLDHDTHGNREVAVESVPQPFGWTGREYDRVSGLYHLRNRDYDPNTGRFLQEDPIWFNAGDLNVYRYVKSNPTKYTDPDGQTAAIQYACMADFGFGAGTIAGTTVAAGIVGVFADVAGTLGAEDAGEQAEYIKNAMTLLAAVAAQSGSQCRPRKPAPPGDCTWKKKAALQVAVEVNCKLGKPSENCGQAQRCAVARHIINRTCYKGGDKPHRDAERDAWRMVKHACGKTYGPPR